MKALTTLALLLVASISAIAGDFREATPEEAAAVLSQIELTPSEAGTLSCDFVQRRRTAMLREDLVSSGHLAVNAGRTLVWAVTSPYESRTEIDLSSDRRMAAFSRAGDFSRKVYVSPNEYRIDLVPQKRDLKQIFSRIEAYVDRSTGNVTKVVMTDTAGDTTQIEFSNVERRSL